MKNSPLISIITVVYNGEQFLEETIQSVINQTYKNIEYIIVDGGSTDGTVDIIKKYENNILYWVSEKDAGIYDAMNKGIDGASGNFAIFMNGGDKFYENDTIAKVVDEMDDMDKAYFGRAEIYSQHSSWLHPSQSIKKEEIVLWLKHEAPNHQAIFFPKLFYKNEQYDLEYSIFADADYKDRMKVFSGFHFIDIIVCQFEFGGVSSSFDSYKHVKVMMREAWILGIRQKRVMTAFKRIGVYNIKYILRKIMGEKLFLNIIKKLKA